MATKTPSKTKTAPARPAKKPVAKPAAPKTQKKPARKSASAASAKNSDSSHVLSELKGLARELKEAAKGLNKKAANNPKQVSSILGSVERMTDDAANK